MLKFQNIQLLNKINDFLNRRIAIISLIFAVIIFFLGIWFVIYPKFKDIRMDIKSAGEKENVEYADRYKYYNQLLELSNEFKKINAEDIKKIETMIPKGKYQEETLAYLEEFVLRNGLLITSANISGDAPDSGEISNFNIALNITGVDYKSFKKIINEIENNLRIMDVNSLSFDPEGGSASFDITVYYFK